MSQTDSHLLVSNVVRKSLEIQCTFSLRIFSQEILHTPN